MTNPTDKAIKAHDNLNEPTMMTYIANHGVELETFRRSITNNLPKLLRRAKRIYYLKLGIAIALFVTGITLMIISKI